MVKTWGAEYIKKAVEVDLAYDSCWWFITKIYRPCVKYPSHETLGHIKECWSWVMPV
jgi:hypothetical protein